MLHFLPAGSHRCVTLKEPVFVHFYPRFISVIVLLRLHESFCTWSCAHDYDSDIRTSRLLSHHRTKFSHSTNPISNSRVVSFVFPAIAILYVVRETSAINNLVEAPVFADEGAEPTERSPLLLDGRIGC